MQARGPAVLCILDGWGIGPDPSVSAPAQADVPNFNRLWAECPHATLVTYGPDVGLPEGQMGNSEVGHTNIGAGRVVAMDLGRIDLAIADGSFAASPALHDFIAALRASGGAAHLAGLVSAGGVHAHVAHMIAAARIIAGAGVPVVIHAITDGRDVAQKSAAAPLAELEGALPPGARIATLVGRYFAMDRDHRWARVEKAWRAIALGQGEARAASARDALDAGYRAGLTDEFLPATVIGDYAGMREGDGLFFLNFRADRARQILSALADPRFDAFDVAGRVPFAACLGMVDYSVRHDRFMTAMFHKMVLPNTLGEWVSSHGLRQFRLAETEKYAHVTFFLNGGREAPFPGEDRFMAPSPKVATYDLKPEMSAALVTERLVAAIGAGYDLIVVNYANPDMVGHTGSLPAAIRAVEAVDRGLGQVLAALERAGGAMLVCADHGNCEVMVDPVTGAPHTSHTKSPVPVILVGGPPGARLHGGRLADIAPTMLALMGLPQPDEMTGESLIG